MRAVDQKPDYQLEWPYTLAIDIIHGTGLETNHVR